MNGNFYLVWSPLLISNIIVVAVNGNTLGQFKVVESFKITPITYNHTKASGHVYGARQCGGTGKMQEVRISNCISGFPVICSLVVDKVDRVSAVFVPNENISDVVIRSTVITADGEITSVDVPVENITLTAGEPYQFTASSAVTFELKGKTFTFRTEFFSRNSYQARTCIEADLFAG